MEDIDIIRDKAQRHQARYKTFQLDSFLRWVKRHDAAWLAWASGETIARLNRSRNAEMSFSVKEYKKIKYTDEPGDD